MNPLASAYICMTPSACLRPLAGGWILLLALSADPALLLPTCSSTLTWHPASSHVATTSQQPAACQVTQPPARRQVVQPYAQVPDAWLTQPDTHVVQPAATPRGGLPLILKKGFLDGRGLCSDNNTFPEKANYS